MINKNVKYLVKALVLSFILVGANNAFACDYPPLVPNIIAGMQAGTAPTKNSTVCVDIHNSFAGGNKTVWDIDTPVTTDGKPNTTPAGIRHMWMMGIASLAFAKHYEQVNGVNILNKMHIYAVIHGTAVHWALNDAWWEAQVDANGNQLYPNGNPIKGWIAKIAALKAKGLDIHLEVCGVTLMGAGLSSDDVYPGIQVNQGAFGRFQVLHQQNFMIIQEGWIDNDSMDVKAPGMLESAGR